MTNEDVSLLHAINIQFACCCSIHYNTYQLYYKDRCIYLTLIPDSFERYVCGYIKVN